MEEFDAIFAQMETQLEKLSREDVEKAIQLAIALLIAKTISDEIFEAKFQEETNPNIRRVALLIIEKLEADFQSGKAYLGKGGLQHKYLE